MALNVGLGITAFTLPAALFPKRVRSSFNGIAAALGKSGAAVGAFSFRVLSSMIGFELVIAICSVIALIGAIMSFLLISSKDLMAEQGDGKEASTEDDLDVLDDKYVELGTGNGILPKQNGNASNKYNLNLLGFETDKSFSAVTNTLHVKHDDEQQ
jgi:hypothetical protein